MTHTELVEMAQKCAADARAANDKRIVADLWKMALEYQERAARLDGGRKPFVGEPPSLLTSAQIIRATWDPPPKTTVAQS